MNSTLGREAAIDEPAPMAALVATAVFKNSRRVTLGVTYTPAPCNLTRA